MAEPDDVDEMLEAALDHIEDVNNITFCSLYLE
jgi:hypothetical protein